MPFTVLAVTVQVPAFLALTTPPLCMPATDVLEELQYTVLLVALEGEMVAFKVYLVPAVIIRAVVLSLIPVGSIIDLG